MIRKKKKKVTAAADRATAHFNTCEKLKRIPWKSLSALYENHKMYCAFPRILQAK